MSSHADDLNCNTSNNEHFNEVLERSLKQPTRRGFLRGTVGLSAAAALPALSACGGSDDAAPSPSLSFNAVEKSVDDIVKVPAGYVVQVVHATGDPLDPGLAAYSNLGSEADDWSLRIGDHHDGMDLFYIDANLKYTETDTGRALLAVNHESSADAHFFHPRGQTSGGVDGKKFSQFGGSDGWDLKNRPADGLEVRKEMNHHGVSIVELSKTGTTWSYKKDSAYNRRVTAQTEVSIAGPAAHLNDIKALMVTVFDTTGAKARGTLNNCGHGKTPWGTYLACEENWAVYFGMPAGSVAPDAKTVAARDRYGVVRAEQLGAAGTALAKTNTNNSQGWHTVGSESQYARWNVAASGVSAANDYRNEPNTFGYNVEIDPLTPASTPAKRVAMGRFAHEAAVYGLPVSGKPLAFYMGCDSRNEYIYKFVSTSNWSASDVGGGMTAGNKYLNEGKLYAAKFNADGTGQWLLLDISVDAIKNFSKDGFTFANQAEVLVFARFAADAVGATKMDRPEWGAVNPTNGEIYFALTNNNSTNRKPNTTDAANPRSYNDPDGNKGSGNPNGHIIRFRETNSESTALGFRWDIFLFGAEEDSAASVNLSGLTAANSFSSPDGLWFSKSTGICWIQTDDGAFTDETNCMLLAAIPGSVGDGKEITVSNSLTSGGSTTTGSQKTFLGAALGETRLRRFLVAPKGAEVTGITETPDGKTIFVNIQHPGENTKAIGTGSGFVFESSWPGSASGTQKYAPNTGRPRSATLAISRTDGGKIGL
jgi:secreted PhoX family phosphatase